MPFDLRNSSRYLGPLLLLLIATGVFGTRYWLPESLFWDENYHIASAQKQIDGVMYMETHPPLGKMLIALGEVVAGGNGDLDKSQLLGRDHIGNGNLPKGFSYTGVRLASVTLMILAVLLLYALIMEIVRNRAIALAFASLLMFDNAVVTHTRSAMLEGIQIFFVLLALWYFARIVAREAPIRLRHYAVLGVLIGFVVAVKANGAVLLLLLVALFAVDQWSAVRERRWLALSRRFAFAAPLGALAVATTFAAVFYVHIASTTDIVSNRTYKASPEYVQHIRANTTWTPAGFVTGLRDHLRYMAEYSAGVPRLDVCKPGENGSHPSGWPLGGKTINYRWNKDVVGGRVEVSYTYLVANPLVWLPVALGVVLSLGLLIGRVVYGQRPQDPRLFHWIALFAALYVAYMLAMLQFERVMYLYHYLLPLVFGIVNLALVFRYIFAEGLQAQRPHTLVNLGVFVVLVAGVFAFFAPLTYGTPLTPEQFELRQWFEFWKLQPVR